MSEETGQSAQRIAHLAALRAAGVDPYRIERYPRTHMTARIQSDFETLDGAEVAVAGRLMALRSQGKTTFAEIEDASGRVQLYARVNDLGDSYRSFVDLEAGDIVGATGKVFRTRRGEITIDVRSFSLLAKCLHVPPIGKERDGERFAGLKDPEIRHRMRYVDLLSNPDVREIFLKRSAVLRAVRGFLDSEGFAEVETPVLQDVAGGAAARPFITRHNDLKRDFKLRISLELPLKRLIVGGIERVYEIGRVFRNESADTRHNPEFTLLELYQAYADLDDIMELVERMYVSVSRAVLGTTEVTIGDRVVDLGKTPWRRLPMLEGIREYGGIDPSELQTFESAREAGLRAGARVGKEETLGGVIEELHETFTQPNLIEPTFVTDFPVDVSPLAKRRADDPTLARRFEVYLGAQELGNAFSELNDPMEQRERFLEQVAMRDAGDDEAHPMDEDYIRALEYGMPPTGGLGIGIDRLVMILTGAPSIRDVILFPALRTERGH